MKKKAEIEIKDDTIIVTSDPEIIMQIKRNWERHAIKVGWVKKCPSCLAGFSKEDIAGNCTC